MSNDLVRGGQGNPAIHRHVSDPITQVVAATLDDFARLALLPLDAENGITDSKAILIGADVSAPTASVSNLSEKMDAEA
jgi:hypothetical protein